MIVEIEHCEHEYRRDCGMGSFNIFMAGLHILKGVSSPNTLPTTAKMEPAWWGLARCGSAEQEARKAGIKCKQQFCMSVEVALQQKQVTPATCYLLGRPSDSVCCKTTSAQVLRERSERQRLVSYIRNY